MQQKHEKASLAYFARFEGVQMHRQRSTIYLFSRLDLFLCSSQNHVLEMALHSSGLQHQSKKLYRDEMSRLMEQDQQLLRQENDRLQAEVLNIKGDLVQSREKVSRGLQQTIMNFQNLQSYSCSTFSLCH